MPATDAPKAHPGIGDMAPDFVYRDGSKNERHLSELWAETPAVLVWLRHFG
jgi:hypothetical protein